MIKKIMNTQEIEKFEMMADQWWDPQGPSKPLHRLNPTRLSYITRQIQTHFPDKHMQDLSILDVGCGGGLACEPLAHTGATVTGIDAGEKAIAVAQDHAGDQGLDIAYHCETVEAHTGTYDVVLALEILEHLDDVAGFVNAASDRLKDGGLVIFSTLNRTPQSFALGIVAAEYLLRWLPRGTHNWKKFIKPSELAGYAEENTLHIKDITGLVYNPLLDHFSLSQTDIAVNYFMSAKKN